MNNAELYYHNNPLQKRDASKCLEEYARKIQWKNDDGTIIDIGCGDGTVTSRILKKFLPYKSKKLIGCDISEEMIQFANKYSACDQTSYMVLDIEGDLRDELRGKFDHAFSFYALHWIINQEAAFTNIYKLLAKGGDCLLLFLGHIPTYDVYRLLARNPKWSPWMKDVERYISPYHDSQDPEKEIKRMMENIGFTDVEVKYPLKTYSYTTVDAIKKSLDAVNPFRFPEELKEDFLNAYINTLQKMPLVERCENNINDVNITFKYHLVIVYGRK